MDRAQLDWLHYKREASLNAKLTAEDRWAMMRDLYEAYLVFQRTKSPEQIARERRAEWRLNRGKLNPRYRALQEAAAGGDDREDDR
jgi:hypothetical protein